MMLPSFWVLVASLAIAYLIGSIPWGVIVSRVMFGTDIRKEGSGNIGATNAVRTLGVSGGAIVFLLDFGKGVLAGALGYFVCANLLLTDYFDSTFLLFGMFMETAPETFIALEDGSVQTLCASVAFLGVVWGHVFSPWLLFRGGKGISAAVGCEFFALGWLGVLCELALFIVGVAASRYVSVGSIIAAIACPFLALWLLWGQWVSIALIAIAAITVLWAHGGNMKRLARGTEHRLGVRKGARATRV